MVYVLVLNPGSAVGETLYLSSLICWYSTYNDNISITQLLISCDYYHWTCDRGGELTLYWGEGIWSY